MKIYHWLHLNLRTTLAGLSGEGIGDSSLRILNVDLMITSRAADFCAAGDIKEKSPKEDLKGGVVNDLDLEIDGNRSKLHWLVLN